MRLELDRVGVRVRNRELLADVSQSLEPGEIVALVGPNGAGKTTLLRAALGLVVPSAGHVRLDGRDVARLPPRERAAALAWLPQQPPLGEPLTVLEVVSAARFRYDEPSRASELAARRALERVRASELASAAITELSGGERQRVFTAAVLAQGARLALLDEPANHLDPAQQLDAYRLLGELAREGLGLLLVTHDVNLLNAVADPAQIVVLGLGRGRVAFRARLSAPELPELLGALFGIEFSAVSHAGRRLLLPVAGARAEAAR